MRNFQFKPTCIMEQSCRKIVQIQGPQTKFCKICPECRRGMKREKLEQRVLPIMQNIGTTFIFSRSST
jgi:hypothetical protein